MTLSNMKPKNYVDEKHTRKVIKQARAFLKNIPPTAVVEFSMNKKLLVIQILPKWKWN